MKQILFAVTLDPETNQVELALNTGIEQVVSILHQLVVAESVKKALAEAKKPKEKKDVLPVQKEG